MEALFPPEIRTAIQQAVEEVERNSSAEVVPIVVPRSGEYPQAAWRAGGLGALTVPGVFALAHRFFEIWGWPWEVQLLLPPFLGFAGGFLLAILIPRVSRWFLFAEELEIQARERAEHLFLQEEVFNTRDRTGMLILVSLLEHQVVVLGDKGIASRIPPDRWKSIARGIAEAVRQGRAGEGLVWGIRECSKLLEEAGLRARPGDVNELSNELRV
jgi:putative membrane protein